MSVRVWVVELVRAFWAEVGSIEPFPRQLRSSIRRALPISIILLPDLRLDSVRVWLRENGIVRHCDIQDRPLRACLTAAHGHGLIFLDQTDEEDEQRFSLAHELAHFLRHYRQPRQLVCRRLGDQAAEVFDGERPPTLQERLHSLLKNVPLRFQMHLMQRGPRREVLTMAVARAEEEADQLAYELLAPAADVLAQTGTDARRAKLMDVLQTVFGLPHAQAADYGQLLVPTVWVDPLLRRLRS